MLKNYSTEADIKKYIPNLDSLKFRDRPDWSLEIQAAELEVYNDFINAGYNPSNVRNDLLIRDLGETLTTNTTELPTVLDEFDRNRLVVDVNVFTGTQAKTIILQGSDNLVNWYDIGSLSFTAVGQKSLLVYDLYSYYRITVTVPDGSIDYRSFLSESVYDLLFEYAIVRNIYGQLIKAEGDPFDIQYQRYALLYEELWDSIVINTTQVFDDNYSTSLRIARG